MKDHYIRKEKNMNKDELHEELMKGLDMSYLMLDIAIATGDKKAKIMKKSNDIRKVLNKIEYEFTKEDSKDTEQIIEFLRRFGKPKSEMKFEDDCDCEWCGGRLYENYICSECGLETECK